MISKSAHRCEIVDLINARRAKITAANDIADPAVQRREVAEAAMWTDENEPTRVEAPQWQWRDANGRIIRTEFKQLKSQAEIDDEFRGPGITAWLWMGATATTAALIMAGFDWLVGAM